MPIRTLAAMFNGYDLHSRAIMLGAAIFGLIVLKGLVQAANESLSAHVEGRIGRDVRSGLADTLLRVDYPFFLNQDGARLSHIGFIHPSSTQKILTHLVERPDL